MQKIALITGITGQDGAYLAEFLLNKGYKVYGGYRRVSTPNFWRLDYLGIKDRVDLVPMDMTDKSSIFRVILKIQPDEVYNLASQSFVSASFDMPIVTADITGIGVLRMLEVIRIINPKIKFYQASSSEMFGLTKDSFQNESTEFHPRSPYGVSKLFGHWMIRNYREAYGIFAANGILFNHESPLRGIEFVTRKISDGVAKIKIGLTGELVLGNLDAERDWGYAKDYIEMMWKMLQKDEPKDYVVATGETHSIREFAEKAFSIAGLDYEKFVRVDEKLKRPTEVVRLCGDSSLAQKELGWDPKKTSFEELVKLMVRADFNRFEL